MSNTLFSPIVSPVTDRKYHKLGNKKFSYEFKSVTNGKIMLPYDGKIVSTTNQNVTGYMLVKHVIDGETFYSEFTGIPKMIVSVGDVLSKGVTIGYFLTNNDEITYVLRNSRMYRVPSDSYFTSKKGKDKEEEKKDPKKKEKTKSDDDDTPIDSDFLLLKPMYGTLNKGAKVTDKLKKKFDTALKDTFSLTKKKKTDDKGEDENNVTENFKLNEEIKRIKKLL